MRRRRLPRLHSGHGPDTSQAGCQYREMMVVMMNRRGDGGTRKAGLKSFRDP